MASELENDNAKKEVAIDQPADHSSLAAGVDDDAAIPKGQVDPVYEAKARVLNKAVRTIFRC
jgi:hypothetical protein